MKDERIDEMIDYRRNDQRRNAKSSMDRRAMRETQDAQRLIVLRHENFTLPAEIHTPPGTVHHHLQVKYRPPPHIVRPACEIEIKTDLVALPA